MRAKPVQAGRAKAKKYTVIGEFTSGFDSAESFALRVTARDPDHARAKIEKKHEEWIPRITAVVRGHVSEEKA